MLLEFDADQRLWQETVRDAVGKQCPPALVRGVAEDGVDPTPVWKAYVEHGWTEMNEPETAVELAIVLEELGRATDPTPFLATMTQFAPLAADRFDPQASGTAVYSGITVHRDGQEWVLDGTKTWITNGGIADIHVVVASVDPELGSRGQASFIVPPNTPGLTQGQKFQKKLNQVSRIA